LRLIFLDELSVEANTLRVIPIALILTLDILLVVILSKAKAESLLAVSRLLSHHELMSLYTQLVLPNLVEQLLL
jgi:hypothetical protein